MKNARNARLWMLAGIAVPGAYFIFKMLELLNKIPNPESICF